MKVIFRSDYSICWIVTILILLPFLTISLYNHPVGDDYWCPSLVKSLGFWKAQAILYNIVPPRYIALTLSGNTPVVYGNFWGYKIIPLAFIFLFILLLNSLFKRLFSGDNVRANDTWLPACMFAALYLAILPGIAEGIYWTSSLLVFQLGILFFLIWLIALVSWYYDGKRNLQVFSMVCCTLIGISGSNEILALISVFVIALIGIFFFRIKKTIDIVTVTQLIIAGGSFLFVTNFNGFKNRTELIRTPHSGELFYSAGLSLLGIGYYVCKSLINPFFWVVIIAAYNPFLKWSNGFYKKYKLLFNYPKLFLVSFLVILFLIFFVIIFLTGQRTYLRISNMAIFFLILSLIYFGTLLVNRPIMMLPKALALSNFKTPFLLIFLIAGFILKNNVSLATFELLSGRASIYNTELNKRYALISACVTDTCFVPQLKYLPSTLRYDTTTDHDPHIEEYFKKKIIILNTRTEDQ